VLTCGETPGATPLAVTEPWTTESESALLNRMVIVKSQE
jgi:hypothetical protein